MRRALGGIALACVAVFACSFDSNTTAPDISVTPPDTTVPPDRTEEPEHPPDLAVFGNRAVADFTISEKEFSEDSCELHPDEMCVDAPGLRKLLHFSVETPNLGLGDLVMGNPRANEELFVYSSCHGHWHFVGYAEYRLIGQDGTEIRQGRKQAFCLVDSQPVREDAAKSRRYTCEFQGIQAGWSDVYSSRVACQHLDITGIPDGDYLLEIKVNTNQSLEESDYQNNTTVVPVTLGDPNLSTPTESCDTSLGAAALETENRECGWSEVAVLDCKPGKKARVACAQACGLGRCSGDTLLRVCDVADGENCAYPDALGFGDNGCGGQCPVTRTFQCPASGQLRVMAAPKVPGASFSCEPDIVEFGG